jgi:hypothetical protein
MTSRSQHPKSKPEAAMSPFDKGALSHILETEGREFYATDRFVQHLDARALETVEWLMGELVVEERPVILDLMASWDSHFPASLETGRVVGLGLNERELNRNTALDEVSNGMPSFR